MLFRGRDCGKLGGRDPWNCHIRSVRVSLALGELLVVPGLDANRFPLFKPTDPFLVLTKRASLQAFYIGHLQKMPPKGGRNQQYADMRGELLRRAEAHQLNMDRRNCSVWISVPCCHSCGEEQKKLMVCGHGAGGEGDLCIKYCEGFESHFDMEKSGINRLGEPMV